MNELVRGDAEREVMLRGMGMRGRDERERWMEREQAREARERARMEREDAR